MYKQRKWNEPKHREDQGPWLTKTLIVSSPIVKNTLLSELMLTIWYSLGMFWDLENGQILEIYYQK